MYMVVRKYGTVSGDKEELKSRISDGFVPLIKKINGFVDYYCILPDDSSLLSVSVFQDEAGARESVKAAADWVAKNLASYFPEKPEITAGEVFTDEAGQQMKKAA